VFPQKRKGRSGVVKSHRRTPTGLVVASPAIPSQLTPMFVEMATPAGTFQAQKGGFEGKVFGLFDTRISNKSRYMALAAVKLSMLSVQPKTGLAMFEGFLTSLEINQVEIASLVLDMASKTFGIFLHGM